MFLQDVPGVLDEHATTVADVGELFGELAAVTVNEKVYLIHPATGAERGQIVSPSGNTSTARARLSPDGRRVAVMWDDGSFDLWDLARLREDLAVLGM